MKNYLFFLFFLGSLTHCISTPPHKDFVVAQTALNRAKKFQADKLYPKTYAKSANLYKKAVSSYNREELEEARTYFQEAIQWAEKAEIRARLRMAKEEL